MFVSKLALHYHYYHLKLQERSEGPVGAPAPCDSLDWLPLAIFSVGEHQLAHGVSSSRPSCNNDTTSYSALLLLLLLFHCAGNLVVLLVVEWFSGLGKLALYLLVLIPLLESLFSLDLCARIQSSWESLLALCGVVSLLWCLACDYVRIY